MSHAVVRKLLKLTPGNPTLAKAEGMMRFYLEGLRPLEDQNCPEILRKGLGAKICDHFTIKEL